MGCVNRLGEEGRERALVRPLVIATPNRNLVLRLPSNSSGYRAETTRKATATHPDGQLVPWHGDPLGFLRQDRALAAFSVIHRNPDQG